MDSRLTRLAADLQRIFGSRLVSLVAYGDPDDADEGVHTLALVDRLVFEDLAACTPRVPAWRKAGLAVPLVLGIDEFRRTLDVFPIEYGAIIERHVVITGSDPFAGMAVNDADLRRACEFQAKSHLIHLREGFLESGGSPAAVSALMAASASSLDALVGNLERLDPGIAERVGVTGALRSEIRSAAGSTIAEPSALFARYLAAVERLWQEVDAWRG